MPYLVTGRRKLLKRIWTLDKQHQIRNQGFLGNGDYLSLGSEPGSLEKKAWDSASCSVLINS